MSLEAMEYARGLHKAPNGEPITRSEKLVLYSLADTHNRHKQLAWPAVTLIATESLMSLREAQRMLASLKRKGVIDVIEPPIKGRGYYRSYRFCALDADPTLQHTVNHENCPACAETRRMPNCHPSAGANGKNVALFSPPGRATEGRQNPARRMTEGRQNGSRNKEEQGTKYEPGTKGGKRTRLSPSERETWDLRRWHEAMAKSAPQVGTSGYATGESQEAWRERCRLAAFHAGISIARLQELMRQFFPDDAGIALLAVESKSPVEGSGQ
jgi:hypothetical protein